MNMSSEQHVRSLRIAALHGVCVDPSEKREHPRYRTFLAGKIRAPHQDDVLCVVRDMSKTGALVVVPPNAIVGREVTLHVLSRDEQFRGVVMWRRKDLAGIRFTQILRG